jgi:predicted amidohydrolase YtcJ
VHLAVNRTGGQAISAEEALFAYTSGSAYAEFREHDKGKIAPGFLADLTLLSDDPTAVEPGSIRDITVTSTYVDGKEVFRRTGLNEVVRPSARCHNRRAK